MSFNWSLFGDDPTRSSPSRITFDLRIILSMSSWDRSFTVWISCGSSQGRAVKFSRWFSHLSDTDDLYDDPCKCLDIRYVLERLANLFRDLQYDVNYVCGGGFIRKISGSYAGVCTFPYTHTPHRTIPCLYHCILSIQCYRMVSNLFSGMEVWEMNRGIAVCRYMCKYSSIWVCTKHVLEYRILCPRIKFWSSLVSQGPSTFKYFTSQQGHRFEQKVLF